MEADLPAAVREHCELFNRCVRTGDWGPFLATFTEDARMEVVGLPAGPFVGRAAIAAAYAAAPPAEPMAIRDVAVLDQQTVSVRFVWASGAPGTMRVTWRGGQVRAVEVS